MKHMRFFIGVILGCSLLLFVMGCRAQSTRLTQELRMTTVTYRDSLQLDFYADESSDTARPLIVLVHGGGFYTGSRDGDMEQAFAKKMVHKGYAVASISYRLTRKGTTTLFGCDCPAKDKLNTFVAAAEDISDAVQFLKEAEALQFDRDAIFLLGSSAGAEGVLHAAFMLGHPLFRHIRPTQVAGVISFAGAITDARYITADNALPTLMFHGMKDKLVPYATAPHHYCEGDKKGYLMLDGSEAIWKQIAQFPTTALLYYDPMGTHDWANKAYHKTEIIDDFVHRILAGQLVHAQIQLME